MIINFINDFNSQLISIEYNNTIISGTLIYNELNEADKLIVDNFISLVISGLEIDSAQLVFHDYESNLVLNINYVEGDSHDNIFTSLMGIDMIDANIVTSMIEIINR